MIDKITKESCTGCGACVQICPKSCIVMKTDQEGFLYPEVLKQDCVQCGLCSKTCPAINSVEYEDYCLSAYAAYVKNEEVRLKSSSGGIFTLLAEEVLEQGGVVFGAAFDDKMLVHHIGIERKEQLDLLRGSKYMQSRIENTYIEAKGALDAGKKVLFTGTGCQIAGLKGFLKKKYENLLTVDVLCHGAPSPKLWERYIREQEKNYAADVQEVFFRNKNKGWKDFSMELEFVNSEVYRREFHKDEFMKLFLNNICLRLSCYNCRYKKLDRPSDLTIGDAWGIDRYMPEMDDDKGTSIILVHTEKGKELIEQLHDKMVYSKGEVERLLPASADSRKSVAMHMNRKKFFKKLKKDVDFEELCSCLQPSYLDRVKNKLKRVLLSC